MVVKRNESMALLSKRWFSLLAVLVLLAQVAAAQTGDTVWFEVKVSKVLMGTHVDATVMHADINAAKRALVAAFMEMERVEDLLSSHLPTSEVSIINREAAQHPVPVQEETFAILQRAVGYSTRLDGLFDITIGPLTSLWGFNGDGEIAIPEHAHLESAQSLVDLKHVDLNRSDTTVSFQKTGMRIDLGGIAKGYAVDRAVATLQEHGVANFLLNAGGDLYVAGEKQPGQAWKVGVKHPRQQDTLLATLAAKDQAVATSGDYERFTEIGGQRYHHILDPRSGYPATQSQSATVFASTVEEADVLATYLFITGELAQHHAFIRVTADGEVQSSPTLEAKLFRVGGKSE